MSSHSAHSPEQISSYPRLNCDIPTKKWFVDLLCDGNDNLTMTKWPGRHWITLNESMMSERDLSQSMGSPLTAEIHDIIFPPSPRFVSPCAWHMKGCHFLTLVSACSAQQCCAFSMFGWLQSKCLPKLRGQWVVKVWLCMGSWRVSVWVVRGLLAVAGWRTAPRLKDLVTDDPSSVASGGPSLPVATAVRYHLSNYPSKRSPFALVRRSKHISRQTSNWPNPWPAPAPGDNYSAFLETSVDPVNSVDEFYWIANVFWMLIGSDWWTYSVCKHCGNTRKWILWRKIPYCVQLPGNRNILRTFLTEAVASDRVDFEYCEPFWQGPVSTPPSTSMTPIKYIQPTGTACSHFIPGTKYRRNTPATVPDIQMLSKVQKLDAPGWSGLFSARPWPWSLSGHLNIGQTISAIIASWWIVSDIWSCNHRSIIEVRRVQFHIYFLWILDILTRSSSQKDTLQQE